MALLWLICVAEISDFSMDAIDIAMTCYDTHISISSGSAKVSTKPAYFTGRNLRQNLVLQLRGER